MKLRTYKPKETMMSTTPGGSPFARAFLAVTLVFVAGCSSASGPEGVRQEEGTPESLTVLITNSPSANLLRESAGDYEAETGIRVDFVEVPNDQLPSKIILSGQSGESTFDIAQFDATNMPTIVPSGALLPLDDLMEEDERYDLEDFPDSIQEFMTHEDARYGSPLSTEPPVMYYRTDLYDALGLQPATTWEEVDEQARAIHEADSFGYAAYYGPVFSARAWGERLYASGGRILDPDTYEPLLSTDIAKDVMRGYLELAEFSPEGPLSEGQTAATTAFSQLDVGQMVAATGWWGTLDDPDASTVAGNVAVVAPPKGEGGEYEAQHILFGWLIGISANSPWQADAWDFLSYALSASNDEAFVETGAPLIARTSLLTDERIVEAFPYAPSMLEVTESATVLPRIPEMTEIMLKISQAISAMQSGQVDVDAGMDQLNDDVHAILVASGRVGS